MADQSDVRHLLAINALPARQTSSELSARVDLEVCSCPVASASRVSLPELPTSTGTPSYGENPVLINMDRNDIEKALSRGKTAVRIVAGGWKVDLSLRSGSLSKLVNLADASDWQVNQRRMLVHDHQADSSMVVSGGSDEMDWAGEESELGIPYYSTYTVGLCGLSYIFPHTFTFPHSFPITHLPNLQEESFQDWMSHYNYIQPGWASDFGKPNCSSADPRRADQRVR